MRGKSNSAANDNKMADNTESNGCFQESVLDNVTDNGFNLDDADFYQDLPDAVVVTNVSEHVFDNPIAKVSCHQLNMYTTAHAETIGTRRQSCQKPEKGCLF